MIPAAVSQIFNTGIFFEADQRCLRALMTTQNLQCVQTHYIIQLSNPFEKVLWNSEKSHFTRDNMTKIGQDQKIKHHCLRDVKL